MRRIRRRDTKPELLLRRLLHKLGYRYRVDVRELPGRPDMVFTKRKLAVFVHGCFWHQHPDCLQASLPKTNQAYWIPKLRANVIRDARHVSELRQRGFQIVTLWECEIENSPDLAAADVQAAYASCRMQGSA